MADATRTTRWRKQPILPKDYDDIPALIKLARQLRKEVVEFEWVFSRDELISLRRGVYEWGSQVQGVYRVFDSRVLEAIDSALGEPGCLSLRLSKRLDWVDCRADCVAVGDRFRLHGYATFDLLFGYAEAGAREVSPGHVHLTPSVRAALAASLEPLGGGPRMPPRGTA